MTLIYVLEPTDLNFYVLTPVDSLKVEVRLERPYKLDQYTRKPQK